MSTRLITAADLRDMLVCESRVVQFEALFPRGSRVSLRDCRKAAAAGLDIDWFAQQFLRGDALATYEAGRAPLRETYEAGRATLLAAAWKAQCAAEATE